MSTCPSCGRQAFLSPGQQRCPACAMALQVSPAPAAPQQAQDGPSLLGFVAAVAGTAVVTYGVVKVVQALTDEEYDTRTLPREARRRFLDQHEDHHGPGYCPGWGDQGAHYVDSEHLQVDHRIPHAHGGRTSWYNSQALCRSCNAAKGARTTWLDLLGGR